MHLDLLQLCCFFSLFPNATKQKYWKFHFLLFTTPSTIVVPSADDSMVYPSGLTATILNQLGQLSVQVELDKLQRGQAIGDERHKQQLVDFITDQRQLLAECLFCFACQSPLPKDDCLRILTFLKQNSVAEADGTLDGVTLTVLMAMLYCLNVDPLDNAAEMQKSFNGKNRPFAA